MKIILIGAGNLATRLAVALHAKGLTPACLYSRTEQSARLLSKRIGYAPYTTRLEELPTDGDLYIFAVKDSVLPDLLAQIPRCGGLWVHTAGSIAIEIFADYTHRYGVFYPMQTFSKEREINFDQIPIFIEANHNNDTTMLQQLAEQLSQRVYRANSEQRKYLHLAAVFACNFSNHLYTLCNRILSEHNIPFEVMLPLIEETAAKINDMPPAEAQTGPAIRYDLNVIERHKAMLDDETMRAIYDLMSRSIHQSAKP